MRMVECQGAFSATRGLGKRPFGCQQNGSGVMARAANRFKQSLLSLQNHNNQEILRLPKKVRKAFGVLKTAKVYALIHPHNWANSA
jgi:hypothetical protein